MKFSIGLVAAALTFPVGVYAQTSQTFHFGEGQSSLPSGNTHAAPTPRSQAQEPATAQPTEQHATPAQAKPKQKARHRRHHRGHVTQPDTYSHN